MRCIRFDKHLRTMHLSFNYLKLRYYVFILVNFYTKVTLYFQVVESQKRYINSSVVVLPVSIYLKDHKASGLIVSF